MAAKTCVYCLGEVSAIGSPRKTKGGKIERSFSCKSCGRRQKKILDASDPYASSKTEPAKGKRKKKPALVTSRGVVKLSPALAAERPGAKSLAGHNYQRRLAAHFAPAILPATFQALKDGVEAGNTTMTKMVLELYELVQTDKRVSIVNDNRSVTIDARNGGGDHPARRDFENVIHMLEETRSKRLSVGNPLDMLDISNLTPTPEGISK